MSNITVRMDDKLKRELEETLDKMGLTVTAAMTIYARAIVMQKRIPFEVTADPFYSAANQQRLRDSIARYESGGETRRATLDELER